MTKDELVQKINAVDHITDKVNIALPYTPYDYTLHQAIIDDYVLEDEVKRAVYLADFVVALQNKCFSLALNFYKTSRTKVYAFNAQQGEVIGKKFAKEEFKQFVEYKRINPNPFVFGIEVSGNQSTVDICKQIKKTSAENPGVTASREADTQPQNDIDNVYAALNDGVNADTIDDYFDSVSVGIPELDELTECKNQLLECQNDDELERAFSYWCTEPNVVDKLESIAIEIGKQQQYDDWKKATSKMLQKDLERQTKKPKTVNKKTNQIQKYNEYIIAEQVGTKIKYTVQCPILADVIRNDLHLKIGTVKNTSVTTKPMIYIYDKLLGIYRTTIRNELQSIVVEYLTLDNIPKSSIVSMKTVNEVVNLLLSPPITDEYGNDTYIDVDKFNDYEDLICCDNGIFNWRTKETIPYSPEYLFTVRVPCHYDKNAKSKNGLFDNWLDSLCTYQDEHSQKCIDIVARELLLQVGGVVASNINSANLKRCLFMIGKKDSGKSKFRDLLVSIIGAENSSCASLDEMASRFGSINHIYGKLLIGEDELSALNVSDSKFFRMLVGGVAYLTAEIKGSGTFQFKNKAFLLQTGNEMVRFGASNQSSKEANYTRMMILPIEITIPEHEQNPRLIEDMMVDKNYIFTQFIDALERFDANNRKFQQSKRMIRAKDEYIKESSSVIQFLYDTFEIDDNDKFIWEDHRNHDGYSATRIYEEYTNWLIENGETYTESIRKFGIEVKAFLNSDKYVQRGRNANYYCLKKIR